MYLKSTVSGTKPRTIEKLSKNQAWGPADWSQLDQEVSKWEPRTELNFYNYISQDILAMICFYMVLKRVFILIDFVAILASDCFLLTSMHILHVPWEVASYHVFITFFTKYFTCKIISLVTCIVCLVSHKYCDMFAYASCKMNHF